MESNVLLAVPVGGMIEPETSLAIAKMTRHPLITYISVKGSPIDQVRNDLVRIFLKNPQFTHLMMMDSDVVPPDGIVDMLLGCDSAMATGIVPICLKGAIVSNVVVKAVGDTEIFMTDWRDRDEPFEVIGAGAGCIMIKRDVFKAIRWPWFKHVEKRKAGDRIGEDIYFSRKAAKHGYRYKANPKALCDHIKKMGLLKIVKGFNLTDEIRNGNG
ncbi:MAG: hypothetical protein GY841_20600 [FCB group bacterium]|nr:hypothetical protein [FCB group bacterium]